MKTNYFVSALALFLLLVFLSVWFGMLLLDKPIENDIIKPPSVVPPAPLSVSQPSQIQSIPEPEPAPVEQPPSSQPEPIPEIVEGETESAEGSSEDAE